ncbi:TPA: hypothetical protein N2788_004569 [Vibrio parahaemolyticus]|uniref:hypothetical protein n=1 Tax=Vibrio sp. A1-1 TaxID=2912250 RepID=UPI001F1E1DA6|nr:hypothetical protein [Vibrio sp. A1-1]MCF7456261.1 hypothetical protein [Vibrio sp. A1-1]HCG5877498.1 hypothetical protein [Vibrio parahaemolyticus]HCM0932256.1 hypothetical protein [Vibrio parahaemolyticus]HCM1151415.1 hypothetical protein [Vibrio parahaemolyticus]
MKDMEPLITVLMLWVFYGIFLWMNPEVARLILVPEFFWFCFAAAFAIASDPAPAQRAAKMSGFCAQSAATGGDMASKAVSKMPMM